ncbi:hypothetical protein DFH06DRAFT_1334180 [Mycena polygramma]|nr:hypothetical protein DFH06DRAFT_1334180 [Mycena polygramma]
MDTSQTCQLNPGGSWGQYAPLVLRFGFNVTPRWPGDAAICGIVFPMNSAARTFRPPCYLFLSAANSNPEVTGILALPSPAFYLTDFSSPTAFPGTIKPTRRALPTPPLRHEPLPTRSHLNQLSFSQAPIARFESRLTLRSTAPMHDCRFEGCESNTYPGVIGFIFSSRLGLAALTLLGHFSSHRFQRSVKVVVLKWGICGLLVPGLPFTLDSSEASYPGPTRRLTLASDA